jgi:hypothetical protein
MAMAITKFCLVLMAWGNKYTNSHINYIYENASQSVGLTQTLLITDRIRDGISDDIEQKLIPEWFNKPEFFKGGYPVKLSVFHQDVLPKDAICIYLDLDTLVLGDLQHIAALLKNKNQYFMLPSKSSLGMTFVSRFIFYMTKQTKYSVGNSSVVLFHSASNPNLAQTFIDLYNDGARGSKFEIDDKFISWFTQKTLHPLPKKLCNMFRRKYMSRFLVLLRVKLTISKLLKQNDSLVVITFNDEVCKPENLTKLNDGAIVIDNRGRKLIWSEKILGRISNEIRAWDYYLRHE